MRTEYNDIFDLYKQKTISKSINIAKLIKSTMKIFAKDEDNFKPFIFTSILIVFYRILMSAFIITSFFNPFNLIIVLGLICILKPIIFYLIGQQKAVQIWIMYNTIKGNDISYEDAKNYVKKYRWRTFLSSLIELIAKAPNKTQKNEHKSGIMRIILNLVLNVLMEILDLISNFMLPAIIIEEKTLKEASGSLKSLKNNVGESITGVIGMDLIGSTVATISTKIFFLFSLFGIFIGWLVPQFIDSNLIFTIPFESGNMPLFWPPIAIGLSISYIFSGVLSPINHYLKASYFAVLYTVINRPNDIDQTFTEDLKAYLSFN
ncbi:MAG: hypothetical protein ACON35_08415 [Candidatus Marinamargulisbacteria bacterium]